MPLRNRVHADGRIVADPARGLFTGNRGILHVADGVMGPALWRHRAWIVCTLDWQGRRRPVMTGRRWTALFFLDEAVALAAGHRPCAYCRREAHARWRDAWAAAHGPARAPEMDARLHAARAVPGARGMRHWRIPDPRDLPDGTAIRVDGRAGLIHRSRLWPVRMDGYDPPEPLPARPVEVLTPRPTVEVLGQGYRPVLHPDLT